VKADRERRTRAPGITTSVSKRSTGGAPFETSASAASRLSASSRSKSRGTRMRRTSGTDRRVVVDDQDPRMPSFFYHRPITGAELTPPRRD